MFQLSSKGPSFFNYMDCIHVYLPLIHSIIRTRNKANPVTTFFSTSFLSSLHWVFLVSPSPFPIHHFYFYYLTSTVSLLHLILSTTFYSFRLQRALLRTPPSFFTLFHFPLPTGLDTSLPSPPCKHLFWEHCCQCNWTWLLVLCSKWIDIIMKVQSD